MANFKQTLDPLLKHEGGYSNRTDDRGGETYRGISRKFFPDWKGWEKIDVYKHENGKIKRGLIIQDHELNNLVYAFYADEFGDKLGVSTLLNQSIANEMMDIGVNCGTSRAVKILQRSYNLCNKLQRLGADLEVDGHIGIMTIDAINKYPKPQILVKVINGLQLQHYVNICEKSPDQEVNFIGWLTRC